MLCVPPESLEHCGRAWGVFKIVPSLDVLVVMHLTWVGEGGIGLPSQVGTILIFFRDSKCC